MEQLFALRGNIIHTPQRNAFAVAQNAYLVCENGKVAGVFDNLPDRYAGCALYAFDDRLIVPGFVDTHVHAPQYAFRGLGMDMELIQWLDTQAFPEECRYHEPAYAARAYGQFADALRKSATTRACVFATVHNEATLRLMELLDKTGLYTYVGKVSMDRNAPDELLDPTGKAGLELTEAWIRRAVGRYDHVRPIVTPRFVPSCTDALMQGLGELAKRYKLPVQSHLSENPSEVDWVKELCPDTTCYLDAYARYGLAGRHTVMAHCVHPTDTELELMKATKVLVSHCPASNMNLASGIAPVRRYLDAGIRVSLGTDIAGGYDLSIFRAMTDAVQASKLRARQTDMKEKPLSLSETFYMGTKGGGAFFGKVGSFEKGYEFDALVLDDSKLSSPRPLTVLERLERAVYLEKDVRIQCKFVAGEPICQ